MAKPIPETHLLHPRDPSTSDGEWPEFELTNVFVSHPSSPSTPASLLTASVGHPLTVTGHLAPLDRNYAHLYLRSPLTKRTTIELTDVMTFSYGEDDAGYPVWAAGKAGWFRIRPGRGYRATFAEMERAVELWYFIADAYREERMVGKGKKAVALPDYTAEELFAKFAGEVLEDEGDVEGARERFVEHRAFVMSCMLAGKEGLEWKRLPLWEFMKRKFPEEFEELKARRNGKVEKGKKKRQGSVDTTSSTTSMAKRKTARAKSGLSNAVEVINLDDSDTVPGEKVEKQAARPRIKNTRSHPEIIATPSKDSDSDTDRHAFNKSGLRPRATKANKATLRKGKQPLPASEDDEGEGHDAPLSLAAEDPTSSPTAKRKASHPPNHRPHKRPHAATSDSDEGIEIPPSPLSLSDPSSAKHISDPLQEDTWLCALDGCTHKIFAASHPDSQRLIREHYALHAYDDDERVKLVKACSAPSLPANHLMERVRLLAKGEGFPGTFGGGQGVSRFSGTMSMPAAPVRRY
ncbi:unnamed protein product [Zymoseptoria tritici ST99CH_1A5]|uniref:DNA (cytosine-5)-methyltransferase 1 replication foci domain-containing protein n=1 Tax=Zymoseptoria tritici ST99CH_1A5 TaxID=1276529 RepID=A0A1Y6LGC1_ZYMTR|nr:unnamed protein product [Zymoseptoria tritici ST99CH_1A5]